MSLRNQVRNLWKRCFDDSDAFLDLYFSRVYTEANNFAFSRDEKVVCALQALPFTMQCFGTTLPFAYVSGACTAPELRRQGLMKRLLDKTHSTLHFYKKMPLVALIPASDALRNYYARQGYGDVFVEQHMPVSAPEASPEGITVADVAELSPELYALYRRLAGEREAAVVHSEQHMQVVLADTLLSPEAFFVEASDSEGYAGLAVGRVGEEQTVIAELLTTSAAARDALLHAIAAKGQGKPMLLVEPLTTGEPVRKGMARIVDAKHLLELYAARFPEAELTVHLHDDVVRPNSGYYHVAAGRCLHSLKPIDGAEEITIGELTTRLFASEHPFMNLMLE